MSARGLLGRNEDIAQNLIPAATSKWNTQAQQNLPNLGLPLEYWCAASGTDKSNCPGSAQSPWRTIQYAMTRLASLAQSVGGPFTLHLYNGVYGTPGTPIVVDIPNLSIVRDAASSSGSVIIDAHLKVEIPPPVAGVASWSLAFNGITFNHGFQYAGTATNVIQQAVSFDSCVFADQGTAVYPATANALVSLGHGLPTPATGTPPTMVPSFKNCSFTKPLDALNPLRRSLYIAQPIATSSNGIQGCTFTHNGNGSAIYIYAKETASPSGVLGFPLIGANISVQGFNNALALGTEGIVSWAYKGWSANYGGFGGTIGYAAGVAASTGALFDWRQCDAAQGLPVPGVPSFWIFNDSTYSLGTSASAATYGLTSPSAPITIGYFQNITSTPVIGDWGSDIQVQYSASHGQQPAPSVSLWSAPQSQWAYNDPPRQFFIAVNGVDADAIPGSSTAPWKTIAYAMDRIASIQDAFPGGYTIFLGQGTYDAPAEPMVLANVGLTSSVNTLTTGAPKINGTLKWDLSGTTLDGNPLLQVAVSGLYLTGGILVKGGPANVSMPFSLLVDNCILTDDTWVSSPNNALIDVGQGFPASARVANWTSPSGPVPYQSFGRMSGCLTYIRKANLRVSYIAASAATHRGNSFTSYATGGTGALLYWDDSAAGTAPSLPGLLVYDGNQFDVDLGGTAGTEGLIVTKVAYSTSQGLINAHIGPLSFDAGTGWTILDFRPSTANVGAVGSTDWEMLGARIQSDGGAGVNIGNANLATPANITTSNNSVDGNWVPGPNTTLNALSPSF